MKIGVILDVGGLLEFKSEVPKGLHKIDGKSIVSRMLESFYISGIDKVYIVVDNYSYGYYRKENFEVDYLFEDNVSSSFYCINGLFDSNDEIIAINSDCFMFDKEILKEFIDKFEESNFNVGIIESNQGEMFNDFVSKEKGVYIFKGDFLTKYIKCLNNSRNNIDVLLEKEKCYVYESEGLICCFKNKEEFIKINKLYYYEVNKKLLNKGIKIYDLNNTYIGEDVVIGMDVEIYPNNYILGKSIIGDNSVILPNCLIDDSYIGNMCIVGPFSNIKKNSKIGDESVIGAFVEIKNGDISNKVKAKHHAYLGDVYIGEGSNIGCGVIVANYDGIKKHKSYIGKDSFVGSNVTIVSPVTIGSESMIAAGSTIVDDVSKGALAIARERQVNKDCYYYKFRNHKGASLKKS